MAKAVVYFRVSTQKQGASGLGLEAQQEAVEQRCAAEGWDIVAPPFVETESGKRDDRPQLRLALAHARRIGAVFVVAKLDRLARNTHFLLELIDGSVDVVFCDLPHLPSGPVGRFMLTQMAAVAELEAGLISQRTKAALQAVRKRGTWVKADGTPYKTGQRLGNPNGAAAFRRAAKGNSDAVAAIKEGAQSFAEELRSTVSELRASGAVTLPKLAAGLNERQIKTPRGGRWHASTVSNLIKRLDPAS